nr:hypothetical protein [Tanacetum cinerariifolium]
MSLHLPILTIWLPISANLTQVWNTVAIKQSNDVTRLQALFDKKKVVVTEAAIRDALHLDDAEGVDCLPNEEIFTALARIGYEKPSTKLTFYKAFFLRQWKFLIHTILQSMSVKRTSWNEFSSGMASVVICLSTEPVTTVDDVEDQSIQSPTPLTLPPQQPQDIPSTSQRVEHLEHDKVAQDLEIIKLKIRVKKLEKTNKVKTLKLRRLRKVGTSQRVDTSDDTLMEDVSNQGTKIDELDRDEGVVLMNEQEEIKEVRDNADDAQVEGRQAEIYQIDMDHTTKVLSMQKDEPKIQEAVEVVTTAKLITEVVAAVSETVSAAAVVQAVVPPALIKTVNAADVVTTAAKVKVAVSSTRQRRGVVIRDPEEESSAKTLTETKSKDKGKGMSYEDIRPIFKAKFNANMEFILKSKEQIEEEESRAIAIINETPAQKATKRRRLNTEVEDVKELKHHLEIVHDEDDDVGTEATPLARNVPVVDYQIIHVNNKP